MAKQFGRDSAVDFAAANLMSFGKSFSNLNGQPLLKSEVWYDYNALVAFAKTDAAYVSQKVAYVDVTNSKVTHYSIELDGSLKELGVSVAGDLDTIVVSENGTISLAGIDSLELEREAEDGTKVKINYQPLLVDGKLIWVEPSNTTVEGLATEIEGLKTRVSGLETVVGSLDGGLVKDVTDLEARVETAEGDILDVLDTIGEVAEGKTVVAMISEAQAAATYDDTELAGKVEAIESDYLKAADKTELQGNIDDAVARIAIVEEDYLKAADKEALIGTAESTSDTDTIKGAKKYTDEKVAALLDGASDETLDSIRELSEAIKNNDSAIDALNDIAGSKAAQTDLDDAVARIAVVEEDYLKAADKTELQDNIDTVSDNLDDAVAKITTIEEDYLKAADKTELQDNIDAISGSVQSISGDLEGVNLAIDALEAVGAEKNVINSVDTAQFSIDENRKLALLQIAMTKVIGLEEALAGKVSTMQDAEGNPYTLLSPTDQAKLAALVIGDEGIEISGKVNAENVEGLADWITTNSVGENPVPGLSKNNFTDVLLAKLNGIDEGAQVNAIEAVSVAGVDLDITDKKVNIGLASAENAGVVKSSDAENKVSVDENGEMEVNSISVSKLTQAEGEYLILNGGAASSTPSSI